MYAFTSPIRCMACGDVFQVAAPQVGAAIRCPGCSQVLTVGADSPARAKAASTPSTQPGIWETMLRLVGYGAIGVIAYKGLQALLDEDFGRGEFPRWFRDEIREQHLASYGSRCPECDTRVRRADLTVDHIVALRNGGRTSRANAAVICHRCNSRKGAANSILDYIRGRAN